MYSVQSTPQKILPKELLDVIAENKTKKTMDKTVQRTYGPREELVKHLWQERRCEERPEFTTTRRASEAN